MSLKLKYRSINKEDINLQKIYEDINSRIDDVKMNSLLYSKLSGDIYKYNANQLFKLMTDLAFFYQSRSVELQHTLNTRDVQISKMINNK